MYKLQNIIILIIYSCTEEDFQKQVEAKKETTFRAKFTIMTYY